MTEISEARKLDAISQVDGAISNAWWSVHKANRQATVWGDRDLSAEVRHATEILLRVMTKVKQVNNDAHKKEMVNGRRSGT